MDPIEATGPDQIAQECFCHQVLGKLRAILEDEDLSCQKPCLTGFSFFSE